VTGADASGCTLPVPGCLGFSGVEVDASTANLRFPELCEVILGGPHPYYPNDKVTQHCTKLTDVYQWVCLM
jgi:hypothetical protein